MTGKNRSTWRKPCFSVTLSTNNPTRSGLGLKPGLQGEKLATNRQGHELHFSVFLHGIIIARLVQSVECLATGMTVRGSNSGMGKKMFLFSKPAKTDPGAQPPVVQWVPGFFPNGAKRPDREVEHSPPSRAEVKNTWRYNATPSICLPWRGQGQLYCYLFLWNKTAGSSYTIQIPFSLLLLSDLLCLVLRAGAQSKAVHIQVH
jgi:hypothetical protein